MANMPQNHELIYTNPLCNVFSNRNIAHFKLWFSRGTVLLGSVMFGMAMILSIVWPRIYRCALHIRIWSFERRCPWIFTKQTIGILVSQCIIIQQIYLSIRDENLLLEIGKFSESSFFRNPYYHDREESLLRRGYQVKLLEEMESTQFEVQYT